MASRTSAWTPAQIAARFPQFRVRGDEQGYFEPGGGFVRPERCIEAQLTAAARAGATLLTGAQVVSIQPDGAGACVVLADGSAHRAGEVVLAAGAWTAGLAASVAPHLAVTRQVLHWFDADHDAFAPGRCPVYIWVHGDGPEDTFYGFPSLGPGQGVKVATEQYATVTSNPDHVRRERVARRGRGHARHPPCRADARPAAPGAAIQGLPLHHDGRTATSCWSGRRTTRACWWCRPAPATGSSIRPGLGDAVAAGCCAAKVPGPDLSSFRPAAPTGSLIPPCVRCTALPVGFRIRMQSQGCRGCRHSVCIRMRRRTHGNQQAASHARQGPRLAGRWPRGGRRGRAVPYRLEARQALCGHHGQHHPAECRAVPRAGQAPEPVPGPDGHQAQLRLCPVWPVARQDHDGGGERRLVLRRHHLPGHLGRLARALHGPAGRPREGGRVRPVPLPRRLPEVRRVRRQAVRPAAARPPADAVLPPRPAGPGRGGAAQDAAGHGGGRKGRAGQDGRARRVHELRQGQRRPEPVPVDELPVGQRLRHLRQHRQGPVQRRRRHRGDADVHGAPAGGQGRQPRLRPVQRGRHGELHGAGHRRA